MKESVKESTTKWAEIKTTVSAYRDLSNNKGFQTKEWLPQEIMSKKYPTESLNEKWKWNLGDSDKLAFSNLFSKDILIFIILGFSGRKRTTLCQLLIKKKGMGRTKWGSEKYSKFCDFSLRQWGGSGRCCYVHRIFEDIFQTGNLNVRNSDLKYLLD